MTTLPRYILALEDTLRPLLREVEVGGMKGFIRPIVDGIHLDIWNDEHNVSFMLPYSAPLPLDRHPFDRFITRCARHHSISTADVGREWQVEMAKHLMQDLLDYMSGFFETHGHDAKKAAFRVVYGKRPVPYTYMDEIAYVICEAINQSNLPEVMIVNLTEVS